MLALLHLQVPQGLKEASIWLLALLKVAMKNKGLLAEELCEGLVSVCAFSLGSLMCYDLPNPIAAVCVSSPSREWVATASLHFEAESKVLLCCF